MAPILFLLRRPVPGASEGLPGPYLGALPMPDPPTMLHISGITKDSLGAVLGGCTVTLYRTSDNLVMETVVSDATTGAYSFSSVGSGETYYVVAYKAGSPDVAGTTWNTLVGT